jgi:hypothetical protein
MPSIRNAALVAGVSAELMVRTRVLRPLPARIAIGAGVLTAGAVVALAHLAGADVRALSGNQAGLLAALVRGHSEAGAHAAAPAAQP